MDLFYHKAFQFARGHVAGPLIPTSGPQQQRAIKGRICKEMQSKHGAIQNLMLKHFREICDPVCFYSLPESVLSKVPTQDLQSAITSGVQPGPDSEFSALLPLKDRVAFGQAQESQMLMDQRKDAPADLPAATSLPLAIQADEDTFIAKASALTLPDAPSDSQSARSKRHVLRLTPIEAESDLTWKGMKLVFFRVCHSAPNRLKRPTRYADSVMPDDLAIRLYRLVGIQEHEAVVEQHDCAAVFCSQLLTYWHSGKDDLAAGANLATDLLRWDVCASSPVQLRRSEQRDGLLFCLPVICLPRLLVSSLLTVIFAQELL